MIKIRPILYLTVLLTCLSLGGCNKPEPPTPTPTPTPVPTPTPTPTPDPPAKTNYFEADIKDVYAFNCGDISGVEVPYKTDINDWTIKSSETWCSFIIESHRFVILVSEYRPTVNPDGSGGYLYTEPRTCTVTVSAGSAYNKTFRVIQESMTFFDISSNPVLLSPEGGSADVTIINNCYGWSASCDASWLTLKKTGSSTLTVTSSARAAGDSPRKATVNIKSDLDDWVTAKFTVADADSELSGEDFNYGDHTDWD